MQTASINICNLCIPCHCHCDYCLLSWDKQISGISYSRSESYARRLYSELKIQRPELAFSFYCGYSMEHPHIDQMISLAKEIDSPAASFLQFNGMKMRDDEELQSYLLKLKALGIATIDLTFYGLRQHHDQFAGRTGDFDYLLRIMKTANRLGIDVVVGVALTAENAGQINELVDLISTFSVQNLFLFVPHAEGRGYTLNPVRFSEKSLALLNETAKSFSTGSYIRRKLSGWPSVTFRSIIEECLQLF